MLILDSYYEEDRPYRELPPRRLDPLLRLLQWGRGRILEGVLRYVSGRTVQIWVIAKPVLSYCWKYRKRSVSSARDCCFLYWCV